MGGSSSSEEEDRPGYYKATHPPAGICRKNGEPCERSYHGSDVIGNCCAGQRCNQVAFDDPSNRAGYYFCFDQYTGKYDSNAADNVCGGSNFLGIPWCNLMEKSLGAGCSDNDELIAQLTLGKVTSCKDALIVAEEYDLSCSEVHGYVIQKAIKEGFIDPSFDMGNAHPLDDICCDSCSSVEAARVFGSTQNMTDSTISNGAGEVAILALAIVGVVAIFGKIFYGCVKKEGYTEVTNKTSIEEEI